MFNSIANDKSTNIFESITGVLNIAPIKLSGKYKIVVDSNNILYLDDYNSRRVIVDKSQPFLAQVGNFLSTETTISNIQNIKYGGFSHGKQKAYHIPLYVNNYETLPKYFVLNNVRNETITNPDDLHNFSSILKIVDLEQIGLLNIFNELLAFEYPLFFNWDDGIVNIFGYSISELAKANKTISLRNNQSNQPTLEVVNNKILNSFVDNKLIFPKFLNIEFEFEYDTDRFDFNNFFGFMSQKNIVTNIVDFNPAKIFTSIKHYRDSFTYKQERVSDSIIFDETFLDIHSTGTVSNISNQLPQVVFVIKNIAPEDYFTIMHPDGSIFFEYIVKPSDMRSTLVETLNVICKRAQALSGLNFLFSNTKSNTIEYAYNLTIKSNLEDDLAEEYLVNTPFNIKPLINNQKSFYGITDYDIEFFGNSENLNIVRVLINDEFYDIVESFYFNDKKIFRLNVDPNLITASTAEFFETKYSELVQLTPINYYSVNSSMLSNEQFNKTAYVNELTSKFIENRTDLEDPRIDEYLEAAQHAISVFDEFNDLVDYIQYVTDVLVRVDNSSDLELTFTQEINYLDYINHNSSNILNMMFNSAGNTAYITPNILNIEKKFYDNNGNLDYILLDNDRLKFHWFLIKGECPEYLQGENDIRQLRYFTGLPKLTSRLIANDITSNYCETVFLGVKYRLPQKYKNYDFAVYLNSNDNQHIEKSYSFDVNHQNKTVYLVINMYLDFVDLLRGGNIDNQPLVDLSFFYSVNESHNTLSEIIYSFKSGGILLCDESIPVMFESNNLTGWRHYDSITDKTYICLKRSTTVITSIFTELFPSSGDFEFYVYSEITIDGVVYNYASMVFKVKNIRLLSSEYVWCEDLFVEFFDTGRLFLNNMDSDFFRVTPENIISIVPKTSNGLYADFEATATILVDATNTPFTILNPVGETFSLKKYYFEMVKRVIYDEITSVPTITYEPFTFNEYVLGDNSWAGLKAKYDINDNTFDSTTNNQKITLFDRNQLWNLMRTILRVDVRFKHNTAAQTRKIVNELLVNNLAEYSSLKSLPINNTDEFIKLSVIENDTNIVIWKYYPEIGDIKPEMKAFKINRYSGVYNSTLFKLENELQFQADIIKNKQDSLFNIFDKDFAGLNIGATGLWNEVSGNIVSSLFCKTTDIVLTIHFSTQIDYKQLLVDYIFIDDILINQNRNENYIKTINNNIDEYIKDTYVNWLLENFYSLQQVKNELNQSIPYNNSESDKFTVNIKPLTSFSTRFQNLIFIFSRK